MADRRGRPGLPADRTVTVEGMGDRAVSDAIGYVLVFALIISAIALVYVAGFRSLDDARQFERMNNAERAFDVLDDNIEDVTQRGAPSRATEVKLAEASLVVGDEVTINVTVEPYGQPSQNVSIEKYSNPITFKPSLSDSKAVLYSMGATFRRSGGGTAMTNEPGMVLTEDRVYIPIIETTPIVGRSVSGSLTVLIRTELQTSAVLFSRTTRHNVTINITTPRADAWRNYFREAGPASLTCPAATNTDTFVSCEMTGIERVYVTYYAIQYTYVD